MTSNHDQVKLNWSEFRSGKITLKELLERNDKLIFKNEIEELVPQQIRKAQQIFAPRSEKGCPVDKNEEAPF